MAVATGDSNTAVALKINQAIAAADPTNGGHVWADVTGGNVILTNDQGYQITVANGATNSGGNLAAIFGATTTLDC